MKRVLIPVLALFLAVATCMTAQENAPSTTGKKASKGAAAVTLMGKIGEDGKTFTSDKDQKAYTLVNPEAVQGHAGHHVALNGHVNGDSIHVMSLKMAPEGKMKKGAAAPKE